jgi:NDP-sugar pyrophosphorylase family protein
MADTPLTVMIPLGGIGSRFQKEGYTVPKPFVKVMGEEMLIKIMRCLKLKEKDAVVVVFNPAFIKRELFVPLKAMFPTLQLVELPGATRGAAETVLIGLKGLSSELRKRPVVLADGDCYYEEDIVSMYREIATTAGGVFYFNDTQPKPMYSYIKTEADGTITEVRSARTPDMSAPWAR